MTAPAAPRPHTIPRGRAVHTIRPQLPDVPWQHGSLFREANYEGGQPYRTADDDLEDDDA